MFPFIYGINFDPYITHKLMFNPGHNMKDHTQTYACTEQSINMINDDVNGVSVSMVTVHVV